MNKKICITGGTGFLGKHIVKALLDGGYSVLQINHDDTDISSEKGLDCINFEGIDYIIHLAAASFVPESWTLPTKFYRTNTMGTLNVLEICRKNNIPLLYVSSYMYGVPKALPINETSEEQAVNPYGHSKFLAEQLCRFYSENYNSNVIILRPFNIYGCGQSNKFLIPYVINQALNSPQIEVQDINPVRDYIYVDDVVDAVMKIIKTVKRFEIYNIGSEKSYSVKEIIDIVQSILKINKPVLSKNKERYNEISCVVSDCSKLKNDYNWCARNSLREGIKKTIKEMRDENEK